MKNEDEKFDRAFAEMMTKAARQFGFEGELEITITRPKDDNGKTILSRSGDRDLGMRHRPRVNRKDLGLK